MILFAFIIWNFGLSDGEWHSRFR